MVRDVSLQERAMAFIRQQSTGHPPPEEACVTINFHPAQRTKDGTPLLSALANSGLIKSQFETGTSNGGLTAHPEGDRWRWESRAFNGVYDHCSPQARPKYGALDYRRWGSGGSPRFGSACFRLHRHVLGRTTFCYPDSYFNPVAFSTYEHVGTLIQQAASSQLDALDNYIEAHIHGELSLASDVEALVLDPVFQGTEVEKLASKLDCAIEWHNGFQVNVACLQPHTNYRGEHIVALAKALAEHSHLNPLLIERAFGSGLYPAQDVKKVWHYLARFGDLNDREEPETAR